MLDDLDPMVRHATRNGLFPFRLSLIPIRASEATPATLYEARLVLT